MALLEAALPADLAEAILGDLIEEFRVRARHEPAAARAWFYGQLARSVVPLAILGIRRAGPLVTVTAISSSTLAGAIALVAVRSLWAHVLFWVPLRAGHAPGAGWLFFGAALSTVAAAVGGLAGAAAARSARSRLQGGNR
jgi:hypothetical protein